MSSVPQIPPWVAIALAEYGVKERPGLFADSPRILEYHRATKGAGAEASKHDETPWCSSFANWCMEQVGIEGTRSKSARSWASWGKELVDPVPGAITVLARGAKYGHVALYVAGDKTCVYLLGGNQGNQVSIRPYPRERVLSYRWPA